MCFVECLSPPLQTTLICESFLDITFTVKELSEVLAQGKVSEEYGPLFSYSSCDFIQSLSLSSTGLDGKLQYFSESWLGELPSKTTEACGGDLVGPFKELHSFSLTWMPLLCC